MADALRVAAGDAVPETSVADTIEHTIVAVRARAKSQRPPKEGTFDPELLSNIERRLARRVGPIAHYLVQTSLPAATSLESLCDVLAQRIDRPEDRRQFLAEALEAARSGASVSPTGGSRYPQSAIPTPIPPEEVERARRALADSLGPIAKILVQRALGKARSSQELWDLLASHIDTDAGRADFISRRDKV
jgi:serine/threonine-protein kinase